MAHIRLVYFDIRGRAEFIRLVLEAAGQEYEEERVDFSDWRQVKPTTPYGALPYMVYNGKTYGQSAAIAAFLAKEFGLFGKTNLDGLRIDEVHGLFEDQFDNIAHYRWIRDQEKKAEYLRKAVEEDLPKYFGFYERMLEENGATGYLVGHSLSLGDLYIYDMADNLLELKADAVEAFPLTQKLRHNVQAHPLLKAYLARRRKTMF